MIAFDYGGTLRVSDGRADLRDLATRLAPIVVISAIQRGHEASIESEIRALGIPLKAVGRAVSYLSVANTDEAWIMATVESPIPPEQEVRLQKLRAYVAHLKGKGIPVEIHTTQLLGIFPPDLPEGEGAPACCGKAGELPEKLRLRTTYNTSHSHLMEYISNENDDSFDDADD